MGFKEDADFARFLTMGAYGTAAVKADLEQRGHEVIELERYAMANKVWAVKVKRLRIPDLLCVKCGRRCESKSKTKLEIKLSHSGTPGREWSAGGMRDGDVFAFLRVVVESDTPPMIGKPLYVTRAALQEAIASVKEGVRKSISAGSEADVTWPSWVPGMSGTLNFIAPIDPDGNIFYEKSKGGKGVYRNGSKWADAHLYLEPGDSFEGGFTFVAGCVAPADVSCPGDVWDWRVALTSDDDGDRYAAVKSCYFRSPEECESLLSSVAVGEEEDWRIALEAAGVLSLSNPGRWVALLTDSATDITLTVEQQMEAVLILSELPSVEAAEGLWRAASVHEGRSEDIRAAAVWGLGLGAAPWPEKVAEFLDDRSDRVALHAAAALPEVLPAGVLNQLTDWLATGSERQAAVAAGVLARRGYFRELVESGESSGVFGSLIAIRALGDIPQSEVERRLSGAMSESMMNALKPIWAQHRDWLRRPENEGALDVLDAQQVRFWNVGGSE
ncbi:hypothetical protein OIE66_37255 [Nonomuraea sp. NBC_01738]|uniref:HEAT repeat domain-containing protein n=1 Tax=Nonomuraea sp. NBC_01738 TaxID=2976003 RepID=UPI002E167A80|nr:hypothetical protein OIE66_37255 [Nonomuraea sp. NBC_01738]